MTVYGGPDIITDGLVLNIDAGNIKSFDPVNPNVELLLHMDGANNSTTFTDSSKNGTTVTPYGNAKISTDQSKFGGSSAYFDGDGDYLRADGNTNFGTGDFTIDFWVMLTSDSKYFGIDTRTFLTSSAGISVAVTVNGLGGYVYGIGGLPLYSTSIQLNTWYHVAFCRKSGVLTGYLNGIAGTPVTVTNNFTNNYGTIGTNINNRLNSSVQTQAWFNGFLDELRIVKGKALYTSNFTPERKPYLDGDKIYDLSANGNNGTLTNGPTFSSANGGVLSFDGTNDLVGLPLSNNLKNTSYTISAYINSNISIQNGTSERYIYYFRGTTTGSNRFGVLFGFSPNTTSNNGRLSVVIGNGSWNTYSTSQSSWLSNTWYNVVITQSGSSYKFYINGALANSGTAVIPGFSGMDSNTFGFNWNGLIPNLLVYNRALSADEISQNYKALKGRYGL